ncbi:MAG: flagellar basal body P-ring formation protein FlgA [Gemmatimonadetes bacterium]|nr:flagellar basal body P-ring formation protein FlgA [Gemmatimonadota bacterium]
MSPRAPMLVCAAVLGLALRAGPAASQEIAEPADSALARVAREQVATRWGVDPALVAVELDAAPGAWNCGVAAVALEGAGSGGRWTLRAEPDGGCGSLALKVRAGVWKSVTVAARDLPRDHTVRADDLRSAAEVRWGEPDERETPSPEGWSTRRLVREGEPLVEPAVQPPLLVRPGQSLEVVWRRGAVSVKAAGRAAGSAALGGTVLVRTDSGRRLQGRVVGPGVVDVTNPGDEG